MTLSPAAYPSPIAPLGPHARAALLYALQDPKEALEDLLRGLPPGAPPPGDEPSARSARSLALAHWLNSCYQPVPAGLFLSAELYSAAGNHTEAAVSRGLLGLFFAEPSPLLAILSLDAALPHLDSEHWLALLGPEIQLLCRARIGEGHNDQEVVDDEIVFEGDRLLALHILWCRLRTAIALDPSRTAGLDLLVRLFLERKLHNEAALAAAGLAATFTVSRGRPHPLRPLLPEFEDVPRTSRPLAVALDHLVAAQEQGTLFELAVRPLRATVSSLCRYPIHLVHETATGG